MRQEQVPQEFFYGTHTATTSAAQLISDPLPFDIQKITLSVPSAEASGVYIGKANVTANNVETTGGFLLEPGQQITIEITDPTEIYTIAGASIVLKWLAR